MYISQFRRKLLWCSGLILLFLSFSYVFLGSEIRSNIYTILASQLVEPDVDNDLYSFGLPSRHLSEESEDSYAHDRKTKWIVLTSAATISKTILNSSVLDWTILLVADRNTPKNWSHPNVQILDVNKQLSLGYKVLKYFPHNKRHYARKIIGYLYAIQNGAEFIYDATDGFEIDASTFENGIVLEKSTRGLILDGAAHANSVINPYAHFGQPNISRRGFPYADSEQAISSSYIACKMKTPTIQQRLNTRKEELDVNAPPLILPKSVLAPFDSRSTLFHYDAFWALLFPLSVPEEDADIWRGYWAQPLLWSIGANLGFFPKMGDGSNTTESIFDSSNSMPFSDTPTENLHSLIEFLKTWSCSEIHIYPCMLTLTSLIQQRVMWPDIEFELLQAWISDLNNIGYTPPQISTSKESPLPCLPGSTQSVVMFNPRSISEQTSETNRQHLRKFCELPLPEKETSAQTQKHYFPSTLLVVVFNQPYYANIWLLDLIYRPHFPNVLYCGPLDNSSELTTLLTSDKFKETNTNRISFVKANTTGGGGCFNYECALRAIDMKYDVDGYFLVQDDALVNIWNLDKYDRNETWMENKHLALALNTALPANSTYWTWWGSQFGLEPTKLTLKEIYESTNEHVVRFRKDRESFGINSTTAMVSESELYYFPASRQEIYYEVGWIFRYFEVYLEIVVPVLASGLSSPDKLVSLPGMDLWGGNRELPLRFFEPTNDWIHPLKFSQLFENATLRADYCDKYVSRLLNESLNNS